MRLPALLACALFATGASAQSLDRDSLLTDAPAVPQKGTVRVVGAATGVSGDSGTAGVGTNVSSISGSIGWTPIENLHADVGAFAQVGQGGPAARVRYQLLSQREVGFDLSTGLRFKQVGFVNPDKGELEFLVAAGRRFGQFELVLNGVFGVETGGGGGKDLEAKSFAGYRFNEALRAGLDSRLQAEVGDGEKLATLPGSPSTAPTGRDYDLTAGPAVSWMMTRTVQLQALVGVAQPKKTDRTAPVGIVSASLDF